VIIDEAGTTVRELGEYLGVATNNVAEWRALLLGMRAALEMGVDELEVKLDSELVVRQWNGLYRVKHPDLVPLAAEARRLATRFRSVEIKHVRRKENAAADACVNRVLDEERARDA